MCVDIYCFNTLFPTFELQKLPFHFHDFNYSERDSDYVQVSLYPLDTNCSTYFSCQITTFLTMTKPLSLLNNWLDQSASTALGRCRQKVVKTINGVFGLVEFQLGLSMPLFSPSFCFVVVSNHNSWAFVETIA